MKLLASWSDDHLPCFGFEHNNVYFEVNWSDRKVEGRLEAVQDGDVTLEQGLKKYPALLAIIQDPFNCQEQEGLILERNDEREKGGQLCYDIDVGSVTVTAEKPYPHW